MANHKISSEPDTRRIFENGILSRNPVLVYAIGICPLIAVAKSAATACVLAILSAILLVVLEVLTALILKKMPKWLRVGVYALLGVLIIIPFYMLMDVYMPSIEVSLGIYIPLLAVNSLNVQRCEAFAVKHSVKYAFFDAAANSIGYAIPLILTGILREALGSSKIFGYYIDALPQADGFLMPFCGFIILGFVAAFINFMRNKFKIGEEFDAKENDFVLDKQKDKTLYNDEDDDSLQNEITVVPENIQDSAVSSAPEEKAYKAPTEAESSASFESSVSRIMHKWASESSRETSPILNVTEEKTENSEQHESTTSPVDSVIYASALEVSEHPSSSVETTKTPAPKKTSRKRTSKKTAETTAETPDAGVSDTDSLAVEAAGQASSIEAIETPAPKKTTRKRTTKKAAETKADDTALSAPSAETSATETAGQVAETNTSEAPAPKKTTRKRTTKKAAETKAGDTTLTAPSADTSAIETSGQTVETNTPETPAPKKTTRKRTTKKDAETKTDDTALTAPSAEASATKTAGQTAEADTAEAPAPKKTTRKRTTKKAAETKTNDTALTGSSAETSAIETAGQAAEANTTEAPAPKKTTRKRTTKKAAEAKTDDTALTASSAETSATEAAGQTAEANTTESPAPKKTTRKRTTKKVTEATDTAKSDGADSKSEDSASPKKTTRKRTASKAAETAEATKETALKED